MTKIMNTQTKRQTDYGETIGPPTKGKDIKKKKNPKKKHKKYYQKLHHVEYFDENLSRSQEKN